MPATKIETGVYIELKRLRLSAIARKHRPDKTASMAKSLKELGNQIQEIVVCPHDEAAGLASEFFDVLAGVGRKEAEESLGWEKGRCTIMYGLTPFEKLKVTLDENEERQPTGPLDDARIYQGMLDTDKELTQEVLAKRLGMEQGTLSQYLSLLKKLKPEVQEIIDRSINLGLAHILQICRLKTPQDQVEMAKKADEEGWTVEKLKAEVTKRLKAASPGLRPPSPPGRGPAAVGLPSPPVIPDPLAEVWRRLKAELNLAMEWEVKYGPHEVGPGISLTGWFFFMCPARELASDMASLLVWFEKIGQALKALAKPEDLEGMSLLDGQKVMEQQMALQNKMAELAKQGIEMAQKYKSINQKAADLWLPKTPQEAKDMEASPLNPRLPNTPAEWAEVEALAPQGPGAVYRWMLGEKSYWTKKASKLSWQDLESSDPITGCHKLIESLRQGQAALSPDETTPPAPKPPTAKPPKPAEAVPPEENPLLEGLDPRPGRWYWKN